MTDPKPVAPEIMKLAEVLKAGPISRMPVGLFVAQDVWDALSQNPDVKTDKMPGGQADRLRTPVTGGIPIALDPSLPLGQVDAALGLKAFRDRLDDIRAKTAPTIAAKEEPKA
jgi:hypothetical protein